MTILTNHHEQAILYKPCETTKVLVYKQLESHFSIFFLKKINSTSITYERKSNNLPDADLVVPFSRDGFWAHVYKKSGTSSSLSSSCLSTTLLSVWSSVSLHLYQIEQIKRQKLKFYPRLIVCHKKFILHSWATMHARLLCVQYM